MQEHIIFRWLSLKSTIEYLGEWEMLYNPDFNCTEFGTIKNAAGSNNFVLSVKTWLERTNAIGLRSKAGLYGGDGFTDALSLGHAGKNLLIKHLQTRVHFIGLEFLLSVILEYGETAEQKEGIYHKRTV